MIFVNHSPFTGTLPYRIYEWGRNKLELGGLIQSVKVYGYRHHAFRGRAWRLRRSVIVRVNPTTRYYPLCQRYRKAAPFYRLNDCYDGLAYVMIHELAHFADWRDRGELNTTRRVDQRGMETRVENITIPLLEEFQQNRELIFDVWKFTPERCLMRAMPC